MVNISTPGYPNGYTRHLYCKWRVTVEQMNFIAVEIREFKTEFIEFVQVKLHFIARNLYSFKLFRTIMIGTSKFKHNHLLLLTMWKSNFTKRQVMFPVILTLCSY